MSPEDFQGGSNCRFAQPMPSERAAVSGGVPISPWIGGRVGFRVRVRVRVRVMVRFRVRVRSLSGTRARVRAQVRVRFMQ